MYLRYNRRAYDLLLLDNLYLRENNLIQVDEKCTCKQVILIAFDKKKVVSNFKF